MSPQESTEPTEIGRASWQHRGSFSPILKDLFADRSAEGVAEDAADRTRREADRRALPIPDTGLVWANAVRPSRPRKLRSGRDFLFFAIMSSKFRRDSAASEPWTRPGGVSAHAIGMV